MPDARITCAECGRGLDEVLLAQGLACPGCGSRDRHVELAGSITPRAMFAIKGSREGRKRPTIELKMGHEFFRKGGRWHKIFRSVDHIADRYRERIEDAETGELVREEVDEPLSDHRGHGDARKRKNR